MDRSEVYRNESTGKEPPMNDAMKIELGYIAGDAPAVLDVGCACGDFGAAVASKFPNAVIYGAELDAGSVAIAKSTGAYRDVLNINLEDSASSLADEFGGQFDYIVFGDILEHLRNPQNVLAALKKCLKPTGAIIASIPNVGHMSIRANLMCDDFSYTPTGILDETHVRFFTAKTIAEMFGCEGLRVVQCGFTMQDLYGMQLNDPYPALDDETKRAIFSDWSAYVCQYVSKAVFDSHPKTVLPYLNEMVLRIREANAPENIRAYRSSLLSQLPPSHVEKELATARYLYEQKIMELEQTSKKLAKTLNELAACDAIIAGKDTIIAAKSKECDEWACAKVCMDAERNDALRQLDEFRRSPSWRITAPLRKAKRFATGIGCCMRRLYSRFAVKFMFGQLCRKCKGCELIFDHNLGGGANEYRNRYIADKIAHGVPCVLAHNNLKQPEATHLDYSLKFYFVSTENCVELRFENWERCKAFLDKIDVGRVVYNNLVYNKSMCEILRWLGKKQWPLLILMHDFFPVCQFYEMVDADGRYCAMKEPCDECIRRHGGASHVYGKLLPPDEWHALWHPLFARAEEVRIFYGFAREIVEHYYPECAARIKCVPHSMEYFHDGPATLDAGEGLRLGIVGSIYNVAKGTDIVAALAKKIVPERLFIAGTYSGEPCENIVQSGPFKREELADMLRNAGVNVVFFPSVWPETFSYIVSELMQMRIPVIAFDVGAQGEKVRGYDRGMIIPDTTPEAIISVARDLYCRVYSAERGDA